MSTASHLSNVKFSELGLSEPVAQGAEEAGFTHCTPVQAKCLPIALDGRDVAGQAQTGTGKTAAFLLAMYEYLISHPSMPDRRFNDPRALILAPTRELAIQIHKDAELLGQHTEFTLGLAFGGTGYEEQRRHIGEGVDVLIGTPGRIIDYFKQRVFGLGACQVAVLDEADRMFDLGFIKDIRYLLRRLPPPGERLNMLFSATLSHRVMELAYEHMNDPELVRIEPEKVTADRVRQRIYYTSNAEKMPLLIGLLKKLDAKRTMVFVNMKREADKVADFLVANGINASAMSGDVPQKKRMRMLKDFQSGDLAVLVGTDVASRGLHIPDVEFIINYDLPNDAEDYVHRIGRTARAGKAGDAISFGCEDYVVNLPAIEEFIGAKIPVEPVERELLAEEVKRPERRTRRTPPGGKGSRGGRGGPPPGGRRRPRRGGGEGAGGAGGGSGEGPGSGGGGKAPAQASGGDSAPKKKRRRKRRGKPGGGEGAGG